jgi:hypothetical protein
MSDEPAAANRLLADLELNRHLSDADELERRGAVSRRWWDEHL